MNEQSKIVDEFDRWRRATEGQPLDLERGNPPVGYFRRFADANRIEAIAVWRDGGTGALQCWRNVYGDGSKMDADEIDMLFADKNMLAVPYEDFEAATSGQGDWPAIYKVKLRTKDMTAGVRWTKEWAAEQLLAAQIAGDAPDNPRAVEGGNMPPDEPATPDADLAARIKAKADQLATALRAMGGAPKTKAEADQVADYAAKFKDLANEATASHKEEKEPFLSGGRAVDAKWFPVRDKSEECRKRALKIADVWIDAEKNRLAEEARAANESARKQAEAEARINGEAPAQITEVVPEKVKLGTSRTISQRSTSAWTVTDPAAFFAYLMTLESLPADVTEALDKVARRMGAAGVKPLPGVELKERTASQ